MKRYRAPKRALRRHNAKRGIRVRLMSSADNSEVLRTKAMLTSYDPQVIDGEFITWTDRQALLPGNLSTNPDPELHKLKIDPCELYPNGILIRIVRVQPSAPNGAIVGWDLQLRQ